jgi:Spy/CpxP family protein refolding chaperone
MHTPAFLILVLALAATPAYAQHHAHHPPAAPAGPASAYAGLEQRPIKALSAEQQRAWLEGQGAGHALAAELNGHPGPLHVLEHAGALRLTPVQERQARELMDRHRAEVRRLGHELVELERELDRLFAERRTGDGTPVARLAEAIGTLAGRIRASHLQTHVHQTALLTPQQVEQYDRVRGYRR